MTFKNITENNVMIRKLFLLPLAMLVIGSCKPDSIQQYSPVKIDPGTEFQTIDGFGTCMINYKEFPGEYSEPDFFDRVVYDLGLSILRIPIPEHFEYKNDDDDPDHFNWNGYHMANNNRRRGMEETMQFVQEFKKRGVDRFMATPWSPPQYMKTNRAPIQGGFLRADMVDEFAEYLAAFIILAKKNWDIDINWVSMQNECIFAQFYRSCLYHGPGMREAVRAVSKKFEKEKINTKILINEDVFFPHRVFAFLQPVFADPETKNFKGNIAVHRHAGPKGLKEWNDLTIKLNRKNWMTETSGHDTTWQGAFTLANDIHNYLAIGNFSAWLYWQISGKTGGSNEQVYTLMLNGKPTKKYYTSKHFYRYIRPGAIRIKTVSPSDSLSISAYKHPDTGILTLVMLNNSSNTLHISLENGPQIPGKFKVYQSTETELFQVKGKYHIGEPMTIPAKSIITMVGKKKHLKDPDKETSPCETWIDKKNITGLVGNFDDFPIKSEWQGASDGHAGRLEDAKRLLDAGNINMQRFDGWTILHNALLNGDGDAVRYLIDHGADVNFPALDGWTPLHAAAAGFIGNHGIQNRKKEYDKYEIFKMVLEAQPDVNAFTVDGWTALHSAVANANTAWRQQEENTLNRIRDLILAGALIDAKDIHGRIPLHWAAFQGYSHFVNNRTVVEEDVVKLLIGAGADVNAIDSIGRTPLHYAAEMGYETIALALLQGGADISMRDAENQTPEDLAKNREAGNILYILENKRLPELRETDMITDDEGNTNKNVDKELMEAVWKGDIEKVRELLGRGADVQYRDLDGFRARDKGYDKIIRLLTEAEKIKQE
jgi:glucuronoarabinoxylan endo-1,4-beta-xylanase